MKLPTVQVADLLISANFDWIDNNNINIGNVDANQKTDGSITFMLIQDSTDSLAYHRNNRASALDAGVEVQIFFSTDGKTNIFEAKVAAMKFLQDHGWLIETVRPDTTDPDTDQPTVTFYISKILRME